MLDLVRDTAPASPAGPSARVTTRWQDDRGETFAVGMADGPVRWIDWRDIGRFQFEGSSPQVLFRPASPGAPVPTTLFARAIQPLILQAQGWPALHASAAAGAHGAVLFCGLSGSGKSTLAYAMTRVAGYRQLADDVVVLRSGEAGWQVVPLPFRARLRPTAAAHFAAAAPGTAGTPPVPAPVPLRLVVVLDQQPDAPSLPQIQPIASVRMFSIYLTHAHCFDEADRAAVERLVTHYLSMADTVRAIRLTYRPDFPALDRLVSTLADLAADTRRP